MSIVNNSKTINLEDMIKRYFKERPIITEYGELEGDEDLFMTELLQLMDDEKQYKKAVKKATPALSRIRRKSTLTKR